MRIGKRIDTLLKQRGKDRKDLARAVEVSVQAVGHWINEGSIPHASKLRKIADFLSVSEEELMFGPSSERPPLRRVPVIRWDEAVNPVIVVDNENPVFPGTTYQVSIPMQRYTFALSVRGDSMLNPAGSPSFPDGTIIAVEPEMAPESGDYVIVVRSGASEAAFTQYVEEGGLRLLKPLNPRYPITQMAEGDKLVGTVREYGMILK